MSLSQCPNDILVVIALLLSDAEDIYNLALTCRKMNFLINLDIIWECLCEGDNLQEKECNISWKQHYTAKYAALKQWKYAGLYDGILPLPSPPFTMSGRLVFLDKAKRGGKNWKCRFIFLKDFLVYHTSPHKGASPYLVYRLCPSTIIEAHNRYKSKRGFCIVNPDATYKYFCEYRTDPQAWIYALQAAVDFLNSLMATKFIRKHQTTETKEAEAVLSESLSELAVQ